MLRTSLRIADGTQGRVGQTAFLSSNAQDFIEDISITDADGRGLWLFLSSNAQDFIEESSTKQTNYCKETFLSSNAQDFIEDGTCIPRNNG